MNEQEQPFKPTGQPLPVEVLNQKLTITLADVQKAIKQSQGRIKPFLKATVIK